MAESCCWCRYGTPPTAASLHLDTLGYTEGWDRNMVTMGGLHVYYVGLTAENPVTLQKGALSAVGDSNIYNGFRTSSNVH